MTDWEVVGRVHGRVTVVMPVRNGARYIAAALDSVAAQTRAPTEVIIVDDESDDASLEIAAAHSIEARVVRQQQAGEAAARNHGLALSRTEFVTFLDQDDLWHPEHVERALEAASGSGASVAPSTLPFATVPDAWLSEFSAVVVPELHTYEWLYEHHAPGVIPQIEDVSWERAVGGGISSSVVASRDMLIKAGGFPVGCPGVGDYLMLVNLARLGRVVRLSPPSVYYRVHERMATWDYDMARRTLAVRNMLREAFDDAPVGTAWDAYSAAFVIDRAKGGRLRSLLDAAAYAELLRPPPSLTARLAVKAIARQLMRLNRPVDP